MNAEKVCSVELKALEKGSRRVQARISTTAIDRDGDVILPSGLDASDFRKNPVVLMQHDQDRVLGKATNLRTTPNAVIAEVEFAARPKTLPENAEWPPDTVLDLFQQGVLKAFSVGFQVPAGGVREASEKDVARFGDGVRSVITNWKLLEFSVVSVPANQDALALAVSKGMVPDGQVVRDLGVSRDLLREAQSKGSDPFVVMTPSPFSVD